MKPGLAAYTADTLDDLQHHLHEADNAYNLLANNTTDQLGDRIRRNHHYLHGALEETKQAFQDVPANPDKDTTIRALGALSYAITFANLLIHDTCATQRHTTVKLANIGRSAEAVASLTSAILRFTHEVLTDYYDEPEDAVTEEWWRLSGHLANYLATLRVDAADYNNPLNVN